MSSNRPKAIASGTLFDGKVECYAPFNFVFEYHHGGHRASKEGGQRRG